MSLDPSENEFGDESAPDISQHEDKKTSQRPSQSDSPTPTISSPTYKQRGKDTPGEEREKSLVIEYYRLVEDIFREHHAACKSDSQERERDAAEGGDASDA